METGPLGSPAGTAPRTERASGDVAGISFAAVSGPGVFLGFWLLGALALLLPVLAGWGMVRRLERRSRRLTDARVGHLATRVALRLGTRRDYRLLVGPPESMPMTWGVFRPRVMLPEEALDWSDARLEAVLSHELAHVARRDVLTQYVAEVARAVHWFNPLAWVAAWRLRVEREHACDDVALAAGGRPSDYAEQLLGLARGYRAASATSLAAVAMARPGQLADRLLAVLDETRSRSRPGRGATVRAGLAAALVVVPLAALAPTAAAEPQAAGETPASAVDRDPGTKVNAPIVAQDPAQDPRLDGRTETAPAGSRIQGGDREAAATAGTPEPSIDLAGTVRPGLSTPPLPVSRVLPASQGRSCATEDADWDEVSHRSNNGRHTVTMRRRGCDLEVRLDGDVDFDGARIGIARMSRDARMRIEEDDGRTDRRLDITPDRDGQPAFAFQVNGRDAAFDSEAQAWYRTILVVLFRRAGFAAEERVDALLDQGGPDAVLRELDRIDSSYVLARYITLLAERAELSEEQWQAVVNLSFERVDSDHYLAQILGTVAANQPMTPRMMDTFIAAAMTLESDHYRTQVLTGVLESGRLSAEQIGGILRATTGMESDHYRTQVLTVVADEYALDPDFRRTYLGVTADMDSDHYRTQVLTHLLDRNDLSAAEKADVIRTAGTMDSDHYRTLVLTKVAGQGIDDPRLQQAFFETAAGLDSDHYYTQAMMMLVRRETLDPALLINVLQASGRQVESDHYLTQILLAVLERHTVTGDVRDAFLDAMDAIESDHYRGQVAAELLRRERG